MRADRTKAGARCALTTLTLIASLAALRAQEPVGDLLPKGVTPEISNAIDRGLAFLARTQNRDGSWRNTGGYGSYPTAMTALAGMAMIGSGSTPTRGRHFLNVRRATDYLIRCQGAEGTISSLAEEGRSMYGHGFSTMFLAEVYGMEEDRRRQQVLHDVLTKAVQLTARSQSRAGGWIYTPDSERRRGQRHGHADPGPARLPHGRHRRRQEDDRSRGRLHQEVPEPDGSIRYSLNSGGDGRPAITAAGVAVLYNAGVYDDQPFVDKACSTASGRSRSTVDNTGHHYYAHLYWRQALYQRGGTDWDDYYSQGAWLLSQQQQGRQLGRRRRRLGVRHRDRADDPAAAVRLRSPSTSAER
jgi:hypothetical protein